MASRSSAVRCNQSSTAAQRGSLVQLEYTAGSGSITIYKCWGKRDNYDGGDTYSSNANNACNIYVNGTKYWKQCRWIGLAPSSSDYTDWSPFRDSNSGGESPLTVSGLHGNTTITVEVASIADGTYIPVGSSWTWTINAGNENHTVTYAANGGTSTPSSQTKVYGTNLTLADKISHNNTTADGVTITFNANGGSVSPTTKKATNTTTYTFSKWKATDGTQYNAKGTYTKEENTTMTAQWSTSTSTSITTPSATKASGTSTRKVTFNATTNGGTCSTASLNSTATVTYSSNGWYTATSGGTKRCNNGGSYSPSAAETVYAQWGSSTGTFSKVTLPAATKANGTSTRTVTFDANGGSCSTTSLNSTATVTYSQTGWWTSASGGTNRGNASAQYTPSAAETLYAQFSSSTGTYSAITLPTATRSGYTFKGWNTDKTATTGSTGSYTPSGNYIMYAIWQLNAPTAASISISNVSRTKILVSCSYTGAELSNYTVYYRANSTGTYSTLSLGTTSTGTIIGLNPNTSYQLYVKATNAAGSKDSSTITSATKAYSPVVTEPTVSNIGDAGATITINATGDTNAAITNNIVYYAPKAGITKNLYDMAIKVMPDKSLWARIFYHNCKEGTVLFSSLTECRNTQSTDKYSRMYLLDDNTYKINGKFEFMLTYPEYSSTLYNRWKQTYAPQNEFITETTAGTGTATGYEAVHVDWTGAYWGGLTRQKNDTTAYSPTWLSGSVGHGNWFYAVGAASAYNIGIPSYDATYGCVELWVRIGDVSSYGSVSLSTGVSTTLTGLAEETDYLVWSSSTNAGGITTGPSVSFRTETGQASILIKQNGAWTAGKLWYKDNSTWTEAKKVYIKVNGSWTEGT